MNSNCEHYRILSPAKINLGLQVIGQNINGLHALNTIFCKIKLYDEIDIILLTNSSVIDVYNWSHNWDYTVDLAYRAAKLLKEYSGCNCGVLFTIKKHIPVGYGLGGGSSNAASMLKYLNRFWGLHYSLNILLTLAQMLGDDVAFFLYHGSTIYRNFKHYNFYVPKLYFVLIIPKHGLSTKDVFLKWRAYNNQNFSSCYSAKKLLVSRENDLQLPAMSINSTLAIIINIARKDGIVIKMTGSGSSLYFTCSHLSLALNNAKKLAKTLRGHYNSIKVLSNELTSGYSSCRCL